MMMALRERWRLSFYVKIGVERERKREKGWGRI